MTDALAIAHERRAGVLDEIDRLDAFIDSCERLLRVSAGADSDDAFGPEPDLAGTSTDISDDMSNVIYLSTVSRRAATCR